ncbi:aspartyl/asparaginyl beta-hydroxylase-like isoform X1 [Mya arenaria]|uniref:aspartyl/asparaginyl beta-hydroxylase-like isoform X1 n=1 Tax=Mya arenaria TaxID=6604 RepID=UPI0022E8F38F|nr:aspartyl/asparaginyl beta-hydroxylase-like isoform X1 [Mya arenaria]
MAKQKPKSSTPHKPGKDNTKNEKNNHNHSGSTGSTRKHHIDHKHETKPEKKLQSNYLVLFVVSMVVATSTAILLSEDVQKVLIEFTQLGLNPFQEVLNLNDDTTPDDYVMHQEGDTLKKDPKQDAHDKLRELDKNAINRNNDLTQDKQDTGKETESDSNKNSNRASAINKDDMIESESENIQDNSKVKETKHQEEQQNKEQDVKEKKIEGSKKDKPRQEDYGKIVITSKGDYKLRKKLDAADKLLEKGEVAKAMEKFDAILRNKSRSPRAMWGKALATDKLAEQQKSNKLLEEAISLMDEALRLSKTPEALQLIIAEKLADRQAFRGWSHKEANTWKYLIGKHPDNLEFQRKLGVCYMKIGKNEPAREVFRKILSVDPDDGFALVHLGFIMKTADLNYTEAIPILQRGIESKQPGTQDGRFFYHLGDAYSRVDNVEMARKIYQQGADAGIFLSADQRSLYNAQTPLTGRPWWTQEQTTYQPHLKLLEDNWQTIRDEGLAQLDLKTGAFVPEEENLRETGDWKQFTLYQRGRKNEENCKKVPKTCSLLDRIPDAKGCTRGQIKFSVMHPGVHVWPHTGPTNCRIRAHLGLKVPEGPKIRVGNDIRTWKEGKFIIFDDSFEHEVWHEGTELRLVLIVDFWHPELPAHEKRTLSPI